MERHGCYGVLPYQSFRAFTVKDGPRKSGAVQFFL